MIMLLFFLAALMILGAAFLKDSYNEKIIADNHIYKIKSHYLAEAGMEFALTLLGEEPGCFLEGSLERAIYLDSAAENEGYFVLRWLETGLPYRDGRYTLISRGFYRDNLIHRGAESEIKALLDISFRTAAENGPEGEEDQKQVEITLFRLSGN